MLYMRLGLVMPVQGLITECLITTASLSAEETVPFQARFSTVHLSYTQAILEFFLNYSIIET